MKYGLETRTKFVLKVKRTVHNFIKMCLKDGQLAHQWPTSNCTLLRLSAGLQLRVTGLFCPTVHVGPPRQFRGSKAKEDN